MKFLPAKAFTRLGQHAILRTSPHRSSLILFCVLPGFPTLWVLLVLCSNIKERGWCCIIRSRKGCCAISLDGSSLSSRASFSTASFSSFFLLVYLPLLFLSRRFLLRNNWNVGAFDSFLAAFSPAPPLLHFMQRPLGYVREWEHFFQSYPFCDVRKSLARTLFLFWEKQKQNLPLPGFCVLGGKSFGV